jgi:hypothetical protein
MPDEPWDDPGRPEGPDPAREAAAALQHDLGKAVRLSAPGEPETDPEALRARLFADLLRTRAGAEGAATAPEVFDAWRRRHAAALAGHSDLEARVSAIAREVEALREPLARLTRLSEPELRALDDATRRIAAECRALRKDAAR